MPSSAPRRRSAGPLPARSSASNALRPPARASRPPRPRARPSPSASKAVRPPLPAPPPALCLKCGQPACHSDATRSWCEAHFIEMFEQRVRHTLREFALIKPRERIGVAISGGKDSLVMLRLLADLRAHLPMDLVAILIDEGISGYRDKTIPAAESECRRLGIPLHIVSFKTEFGASLDEVLAARAAPLPPSGRDGGVSRSRPTPPSAAARRFGACTYCGVFRRTLLNRAARRLRVDKLALGHNLDDAAQTVLMNLMRNEPSRLARFGPLGHRAASRPAPRANPRPASSGPAPPPSSSSSPPSLIPRIQPLIRCPEKEVALYAVLSGLPIHFMSCPNANEAMRQTVRAQLNEMEERYPGTKARIFDAFLSMQPALLAGLDAAPPSDSGGLGTCPSCGDASSGGLCAACKLLSSLGLA